MIFYTPTVPEVIEEELGYDKLGQDEEAVQMREAHFGVNTAESDEELDPELETTAVALDARTQLVVKLARRQQVLLFFCFNIVVVVTIAMGFLFMWATYPYSPIIVWYSYGLSAIGVLAVLFQFTPQIYLTYKIKERGVCPFVSLEFSLSLLSLTPFSLSHFSLCVTSLSLSSSLSSLSVFSPCLLSLPSLSVFLPVFSLCLLSL